MSLAIRLGKRSVSWRRRMRSGLARGLIRDRRILTLAGQSVDVAVGTRSGAEAIERWARTLSQPSCRDIGETVRRIVVLEVAERLGSAPADPYVGADRSFMLLVTAQGLFVRY